MVGSSHSTVTDIDARRKVPSSRSSESKSPFWKKAVSWLLVSSAPLLTSCGGSYLQLPESVRTEVESRCDDNRRCELDILAEIAANETADPALRRMTMEVFERVLTT